MAEFTGERVIPGQVDADLLKEPLDPLTRLPDEDAVSEQFVGGWVLADDQDACRTVEPPAVEDGPELFAEPTGGVEQVVR